MTEYDDAWCDTALVDDDPPALVRGTAGWHVAASLQTLLAQLNTRAPRRSKASDGSIGDAAHATRDSDHNPWYRNTVTARDFTHDPAGGLDGQWLANTLVAARDPRIKYIIWNRRIIDSRPGQNPWQWEPYHGTNAHTHHVHVSVMAAPSCESTAVWNLGGGGAVPPPSGRRVLYLTTPPMEGDDVRQLQRVLRAWYGLPTGFVDGYFGPGTAAAVKRAQAGTPPPPILTADGEVGPDTRRKLGLPA